MGVSLRILEMDFSGLLVALNAGQADPVISGMSDTEERRKAVDFSKSYNQSEQVVLILAEDKDKLSTVNDFEDKRIAIQSGSIQEIIAKEQLTGSKTIPFPKIISMIMELKDIGGVGDSVAI